MDSCISENGAVLNSPEHYKQILRFIKCGTFLESQNIQYLPHNFHGVQSMKKLGYVVDYREFLAQFPAGKRDVFFL